MANPASAHKVEQIRKRISDLLTRSTSPSIEEKELLQESLEELMGALEELSVMQEELRQQNEELETSRKLYQNLFDFAPDGYLVTNPSGIILSANQSAAHMLNVQQTALSGKPLGSFVAEDVRNTFYGNLSRIAKGVQNCQTTLTPRGRRPFPVAISAAPLTSTDSSVQVLWLIRDITLLKRAEAALRASERKFKTLAANAPDIIARIDSNLRYIYVNPVVHELTGIPAWKFIGRTNEELGMPAELRPLWDKALREVFENAAPASIEFDYTGSQRTRSYQARCSPELTKNGVVRSVICVVRDITEQKRLEEDLRQSEERYRRLSESLEEAVKKKVDELQRAQSLAAIGQMVSVVAHEVRNPLQNIRMGVDALRNEMGVEKGKQEILEEIEHGLNRLTNVCDELFEYSKPTRLERSSWKLHVIVQEALHSLKDRIQHIVVHTELEEGREILVDAPKIVQVLVNLISNAIDSMPNGGDLWIRTRLDMSDQKAALKLTITDTGSGISEENLLRVREPFFTTKVNGAGLGISICRKIIEAHGGRLDIKSTINEGTTIEITLPI